LDGIICSNILYRNEDKDMAVTFYRLWDLLNRKHMKKKDLKEILSPATIQKLNKNEIVTTETLNKICLFLDCEIEDICEVEKENEE
jgi:DNA-binding Xre family transcriptional regulator